MQAKKITALFILAFLGIAASLSVAIAANVTVSETTRIYLPSINKYFNILTTSNALDEVQVDTAGTYFSIRTSLSTGRIEVSSPAPDKLDIGGAYNSAGILLTSCDDTNGALLRIDANTTAARTVIVMPPASTQCSPVVASTPDSNVGGGGGTGISSGPLRTGTTTTATTTVTTTTTTTGQQIQPTTTPTTTATTTATAQFRDVSAAGSARLSSVNAQKILQIAQRMITNNSFRQTNKFKPFATTTRSFAIQVALGAVKNRGCGTRVSTRTCLNAAVSADFVERDDLPANRIKRVQYYEMLIRAAGLQLIPQSQVAANLCSDVRSNDPSARVIATAKFYGIAQTFGTRCRANKTFKRWEAAVYADRAVAAMSR